MAPAVRRPGRWLLGLSPRRQATLAQAEVLDEWWMDLCGQLGMSLNLDKHQRNAQSVEYSGLLFDTFRGLMLVPAAKQE